MCRTENISEKYIDAWYNLKYKSGHVRKLYNLLPYLLYSIQQSNFINCMEQTHSWQPDNHPSIICFLLNL
jgi:hypothetical protein